ncbi:hypothetical protein [Halomicrococcus sp. NG-SE-24]|uniref:hypothetical protein n=1 Tax=Halomicrococcus sp. NG-SE-24 TaxID=3436928 RepID=UPI003D97829E
MPTYNIVNEGGDNTGGTAIDSVLGGLVGSDTTIIFPPGTYKLNELVVESGTTNLELIAPEGARLVPGRSGDNVRWIDVYSNDFVLDGFELDMRDTPVPPFVRMNSESGDWELRRLVTRGKVRAATDTNVGSNDSGDARTYFRLSAAAGTRGLLQDCYFHEGSCEPTEASNRRAILVESANGDLVFNRCWFESWGENTIYAKKPAGALSIFNCFFRNTQNGMRLGGETAVRNCVSIKDGEHPVQAWSGGSLQRGVNAEATAPTDLSRGIDSYNGTLTVADSDFYHRYLASSCGGAITAPQPCERINVQDVRISYNSTKNHDAIYTYESSRNLAFLQFEDVYVRNDHDSEYAVWIGQAPDTWGTVSGILGGSGPQTNSSFVSSRMTTNGDPPAPDTTPPLPSPPPLGEIPLQPAQLVRIDNTGNNSAASYEVEAGDTILPAGNDGATVTMEWGTDGEPLRPPNSQQAIGTVPVGEVYAFYVTGGIVSATASGSATVTVDGQLYTPSQQLLTDTLTGDQPNRESWTAVDTIAQQDRVVIGKPLSSNGGQPTHVRLQNVADGDFEYQFEEWAYLDGRHVTETFHSLAVQPMEQVLQTNSGTSYRVKAETLDVNHTFESVSLGEFFGAETPVVLAQSQTVNGTDPIVTRIQNVSADSFDVRLQEEEAKGGHIDETVGYIALQQGSGILNGRRFEVQQADATIDDTWTRITFDQQYNQPQFTAGMQTFNGADTASLRYRNLTGTGVEIRVEEEQSADEETVHRVPERVGYVVTERDPALLTTTRTNNQPDRETWNDVDTIAQQDRVVISKPVSFNGSQPTHVRLRNVANGDFEYQLEEWRYLDGSHANETIHSLAVEPTEQILELNNGDSYRVKAGTASVNHMFEAVSLGGFFGSETPVVLAQSQTVNGTEPIVTRIQNVSADSFDVRLQEAEASEGWHANERVGYVALQQASGTLNGNRFEVQQTQATVDDTWTQITFDQQYTQPQFVAGMQTFNGIDTAELRYRNLTSTGVEIKVEEEQSADEETAHRVPERVGYLVMEAANIDAA